VVSDRIFGRERVDYVLDARRGQTVSIRFAPSNSLAFFDLLGPRGEALFVGQDVGNRGRFEARLGATGTYTIRVYLERAEARRGGSADYRLAVSVTGGQEPEVPVDTVGVPEQGGPKLLVVAGLKAGDSLNARRGPSINEPVVIRFATGKVLKNLGCRQIAAQRWCQVQDPNLAAQRGWANGRFLQAARGLGPDVGGGGEPEPIIEENGPELLVVAGLKVGDKLNARSKPSLNEPVVTRFSVGKVLKNLGCRQIGAQRWCQVQNPLIPVQRGWVNGRFLQVARSLGPNGGGEPEPADTGIPEEGGPDFYVVTGLRDGETLNVRAKPILAETVTAQFTNGIVLQNLGCSQIDGRRWCQVQNPRVRSQRGWVNGRFLRESSGPVAEPRPDDDGLAPGTRFNATGEIECTLAGNARVDSCPFGVARGGQDEATVVITLPDGDKRVMAFSGGRVRSLSSVSGFSFRREGDVYFINVNRGQERFVIVDTVINGG
jgi:uncharacterized protein YraI